MAENKTYKFNFERRAYNEDATEEEVQAIKNEVFMYDKEIVYYKEILVVSPFSINISFDEVDRLGQQMGKHGLLIDVRYVKNPDARTRRAINSRFTKTCESVEHVSFCTGKNVLLNTAARFVMYQTNLNSFSIHKTVEASIQAIKKKLNG